MNGKTAEIFRLQRSSTYWAGRAQRHLRAGNRRRAAALLRHALTLAPQDSALRMEYAKTLQDMECYEASNREAFGALTRDPRRYALYGVIGRNMLALGHEQEAMDAFARYLLAVRRSGDVPEFDEELEELEEFETGRPDIRARHDALLNIAGRRLARGAVEAAERALAAALPARDADDRYDCLLSLLGQAKGDARRAVQSAQRASLRNPWSARALCTLAGAYAYAGERVKAASALLKASLRCQGAQDEQLLCYSAASLGFPELSMCALRRALKWSPERLPAAYDLCVTLLKLGRLDDAEGLAHMCRDLDPSDVPARSTHRTIAQWRELSLTPAQVRAAARTLPFYPLLSAAQNNELLAQLALALEHGAEAFSQQLMEDENLYATLLYALGESDHQWGRLVPIIAAYLPPAFAERMLREVLVLHTEDDAIKRYAAAALMNLEAKPPFVVWHAGRIAEIDPSVQTRRDGNITRIMLVRRMADIHRMTGDARLMTHALRILHSMGRRRRSGVARDADRIFRAALEQHYLLTFGLPDNPRLRGLLKYTADERRRVRAVFQDFCTLVPIPIRPTPQPGR